MMTRNWQPVEPIRTKAMLNEFVRGVWDNVSYKIPDLLKTVRSMPRRLEEVIANDGYSTKY